MGILRDMPIPTKGTKTAAPAKNKLKPPEQTFAEAKYLRYLVDRAIPVHLKLSNNEEVSGTIEFYDQSFIRITRKDAPNLFVYKHDIKYLYEEE